MDLKELENGVQPDKHWYYQSKKLPLIRFAKKLIARYGRITIVDVGSGSGFFALELEHLFGEQIDRVFLVDINYTAEELEATRGAKIEKRHAIPPTMNHCLVVLMDVLEHLPDDLEMLSAIKRAAQGNENHFFITVPAFQSLWSGHDVFLGHYRRYRITTLRNVIQQAGFQKARYCYLYGSLFPMVWAFRKISNLRGKTAGSHMKPSKPLVNKALLAISRLDMKLAAGNRMFGVTCSAQGLI